MKKHNFVLFQDDQPNAHIDPAQNILFTLNLGHTENADYLVGSIVAGSNPERLEKSETGLPYIKTLWNINIAMDVKAVLHFYPIGSGRNSDDSVEIVISNTTIGDNFPVKLKTLGKHVAEMLIDNEDVHVQAEFEAEVGANYEILMQFSKDNPDFLLVSRFISLFSD